MPANFAFTEYDDLQHKYYYSGRELPSVTTVLDRAGLISQYCRDEIARFRGSAVHEYCAQDDETKLDMRKVPREFRRYLYAWRSFRSVTGFNPILIEHRVDNLEFGYSGRFDRLGIRTNGKFETLLDIKTSKTGVVPDYARLQLAAYALAYNATKTFERMACVLKPDGTFNLKIYPIADNYADRAEWLNLLFTTTKEKQQ